MREISKKQKELLEIIIKFKKEKGYSPSIRELCLLTKTKSSATVHAKLKLLREKGYIRYENNTSRTIKVLREAEELENE